MANSCLNLFCGVIVRPHHPKKTEEWSLIWSLASPYTMHACQFDLTSHAAVSYPVSVMTTPGDRLAAIMETKMQT